MKLNPAQIRDMIIRASKKEIEVVWIRKIMERQTLGERATRSTNEENGVGLNACDAGTITYYYDVLTQGWQLTEEQIEDARKKLLKYSKQFAAMTA